MKTSKVKTIQEVKEWGEGDRKTYYHNLEMDNGDKINIGKKARLEVGAELHYEIIGDEQHEYRKAKTVNPEFNKQSTDNLKGIKIGHALNCASVLFSGAGDSITDDQIEALATRIYRISEKMNNEL